MSKVTIYLAPVDILGSFLGKDDTAPIIAALPRYTRAGSLETELTGFDAAEEAFDLTNNPSRQEEREQKYGNGRSVSTGDIVDVDGYKYVCKSFGWTKL